MECRVVYDRGPVQVGFPRVGDTVWLTCDMCCCDVVCEDRDRGHTTSSRLLRARMSSSRLQAARMETDLIGAIVECTVSPVRMQRRSLQCILYI